MIKNQYSNTLAVGGSGTTKKKTNTTNGLYSDMILSGQSNDAKISLHGQSNASTGGLYGQVIGTGNTTTPTWGNSGKIPSGIPTAISGTGAATVKPIDNSQNFNSSVVKTASSLSGGGNKGGVTDEGVITGNSNVNNSTFNNTASSKTATTETKTTASGSNSILSKLTGGKFASGVRDLITRLFGTKSTTTTTNTAVKNTSGTSGSGTTYAENIGTGTTAADNSENTEITTAENNASATTESATESTTEKPMSYTEYLETLKAEAEKSRQEADKEAEIAKERAMVDAQSSYAQNKATYGANAETMAQMGLTGGGYSDYLQAQAYAQKRSDVQQANVVESATKAQNRATYQDYVNSVNEKLAEKALYDEQLAEQRAYEEKQLADERAYNEKQTQEQREYEEKQAAQNRSDSLYASLWEGVQDTDTTYTDEAIRAIGAEYGLSEAQITTLTSLLAATKAKSEEEKSTAIKDAAISDITTNGGDVSDGYLDGLKDLGLSDEDAKDVQNAIDEVKKKDYGAESRISMIRNGEYKGTREQLYDDCLQNRNAGYITDSEIEQVMSEYDLRQKYESGAISADTYYSACNGDKVALTLANAQEIAKKYVKTDDKVVSINSDSYKASDWGSYNDISKSDSKQGKYLAAIIADAKAGRIEVGQVVGINYGACATNAGAYVYIGNGVFVKCKEETFNNIKGQFGDKLYIPNGYYFGGFMKGIWKK